MLKQQIKTYLWQIIKGESKDILSKIIWGFLFILSIVYFFVWFLRNLIRTRMGKTFKNKVVSVGNVTMGGVGKTPFVIYLTKQLLKQQRYPIIVTRGYTLSKDVLSDEVMMMKELLKDTPIFVGKKRAESIQQAEDLYKNKENVVFLMDDGFQHWDVGRNIDIVLLDARNPFGNGCLIPAGILREPLVALKRAHFFVLTHADSVEETKINGLEHQLKKMNEKAFLLKAMHSFTAITNLVTEKEVFAESFIGEKVALCSAIAHPESFQEAVSRMGVVIEYQRFFIDHFEYTQEQMKSLLEEIKKKGIQKIFVTHKDAVKLKKFSFLFDGIEIYVVHIEIKVIYGENEFLSRLAGLLVS